MNKDEFEEKFKGGYAKGKTKFYANPIFAAQAGIVVGVVGTLLVQWIF